MESVLVIYSTLPSLKEARRVASGLLEKKLIACANILPGGLSVYEWEGQMKEEPECYLLLKTCEKVKQFVIEYLKKEHPYDCPAILTYDAKAPLDFAFYVKEQVS